MHMCLISKATKSSVCMVLFLFQDTFFILIFYIDPLDQSRNPSVVCNRNSPKLKHISNRQKCVINPEANF